MRLRSLFAVLEDGIIAMMQITILENEHFLRRFQIE